MKAKVEKHPQYVKVKRLDTTYFLMCDEYDNVSALKAKVASLADQPPEGIRLYLDKKILDDNFSCHDQKVVNNSTITAQFKVQVDGKEEWESLEPPTVSEVKKEEEKEEPKVEQ